MARIFSEQIDETKKSNIQAIKLTGSDKLGLLITALIPKTIPILSIYGFYRLECAIRGATLLGVFGLGGIGTELQLTLQSLEFKEMWTGLWMLGIMRWSPFPVFADIYSVGDHVR